MAKNQKQQPTDDKTDDEIDTTNLFFVAAHSQGVIFMRPVPQLLSKVEALTLAAWIVSIADETGDEFQKHLDAVQNT